MTEFKAGDRVRYTGAQSLIEDGEHLSPDALGWEGVVAGDVEEHGGGVWNNGRSWLGYISGNLELIRDDSELAELRAFKETALASGYVPPEPPKPETDQEAVNRIVRSSYHMREAVTLAIAWTRANPR